MLNNVYGANAYNPANTQLDSLVNSSSDKVVYVQQNFFIGGGAQGGYVPQVQPQPQFGGYPMMQAAMPAAYMQNAFGGSLGGQDLGLMGLGAQPSSLGGYGLMGGYQQPQAGYSLGSLGGLMGGSALGSSMSAGSLFGAGNQLGSSYGASAYGDIFGGSNSISLLIGSILNNLQSMMASILQLMGGMTGGLTGGFNPAPAQDNPAAVGTSTPVDVQADTTTNNTGAAPAATQDYVYEYTPEQQAAYNNDYTYDAPPPPVYEQPKILGSAGLFGDPLFGLFSTDLGTIPEKLKAFESGIQAGQEVTLISDADKSGLNVAVKGIQVDPNNANSTGVGEITLKSGNDIILIKNNGDLLVNGEVKGNISADGLLAPITLASGAVISTAQEIDGAGGVKTERFSFSNGEYKITAALRKPHADSSNYFDMNFEELVKEAADNASGYSASIAGLNNKFGIVDLLQLEPGDLTTLA